MYAFHMMRVNIADAKARLPELIDAALSGEEVVIARRNVAVVRLTVVKNRTGAKFGMFKGRIRTSDDFDAPLAGFSAYMPPASRKRRRKR